MICEYAVLLKTGGPIPHAEKDGCGGDAARSGRTTSSTEREEETQADGTWPGAEFTAAGRRPSGPGAPSTPRCAAWLPPLLTRPVTGREVITFRPQVRG